MTETGEALASEEVPTETLVPSRGHVSILERYLAQGTGDPLERIEKMAEVLDRLRRLSIAQTYPSDWIIHASFDGDGNLLAERGYLQDIGADRAGKVWGIQLTQPIVEREEFNDSTFAYHFAADAHCRITGEYVENVEGSRWSGDRFFKKSIGADEKVDPVDVRKAAYANLHGRAVRALAGLGGVPLEALGKAGLDVSKCVRVSYAKGAKGGESTGAGTGSAGGALGPQITFGKSKGKRASELNDKDLAWYVKALTENVADESKAQYRDNNQRTLDGLLAEQERRKNPAMPTAEKAAIPEPKNKGEWLTLINKRLVALPGIRVPEFLSKFYGVESVSDLTDDNLTDIKTYIRDDDALRDKAMEVVEHE